jgi:DNA-binding SARP family transcriptional activator
MLRLELFGELRVFVDDREVIGPLTPRQKPKALLAYLYLRRGRFVPRDELLSVLWPEADAPGPGRLKQTALVLRRLLHPAEAYILQRSGAYAFNTCLEHTSDLETFERELLLARTEGGVEAGAHYLTAFAVRRADLLTELRYETWANDAANRNRLMFLEALDEAARYFLQQGNIQHAIGASQRAVGEDPLRESSVLLLMQALERADRALDAIRAYDELRQGLARTFEVAPGAQLTRLYERLRTERGYRHPDPRGLPPGGLGTPRRSV